MHPIHRRIVAGLAGAFLAATAWAGQAVNVNTASAEMLAESLEGIGLSKARAIVAYREANGPFRGADELVKVKGVGLATVDRNRDFILISDGKQVAKED